MKKLRFKIRYFLWNLKGKLNCLFGNHDWEYNYDNEGDGYYSYWRTCLFCEKEQYLNPDNDKYED